MGCFVHVRGAVLSIRADDDDGNDGDQERDGAHRGKHGMPVLPVGHFDQLLGGIAICSDSRIRNPLHLWDSMKSQHF